MCSFIDACSSCAHFFSPFFCISSPIFSCVVPGRAEALRGILGGLSCVLHHPVNHSFLSAYFHWMPPGAFINFSIGLSHTQKYKRAKWSGAATAATLGAYVCVHINSERQKWYTNAWNPSNATLIAGTEHTFIHFVVHISHHHRRMMARHQDVFTQTYFTTVPSANGCECGPIIFHSQRFINTTMELAWAMHSTFVIFSMICSARMVDAEYTLLHRNTHTLHTATWNAISQISFVSLPVSFPLFVS